MIRRNFLIPGFAALLFSFAANAQTTRQNLPGHIPKIVSHLAPIGRLQPSRRLNLAVGLPLRNQTELDNFLTEVSDPTSLNYRHYLTPQQFTEKFGPTEQDYQTVENFFRSNGFTVAMEHPNRVVLDVNGSAADIERVFHTTLRTYRHPTEDRTFFAPDVEPAINLSVKIADVSGLSDYSRPHPKYIQSPTNGPAFVPKSGSGPSGSYIGNDFRATYAPGVTLNGAGQTVALVQFDGYYLKDITNYENQIGLSPANYVSITNIYADGYDGTPTPSGNIEVSLDMEMVISMAPGISKLIMYEGNPNNFFPNDVLNRIAADDAASQISSSWGWSGGPDATTEAIFKQMIAQGQSYYNASGDSDAFTNNQVDDPNTANQPSGSTNVIQVGGTTLNATNPVSETAWNQSPGVGTSGGISLSNTIPSWQVGINMTTNLGSTVHRNIPDVAMTAQNIYVNYGNGSSGTFGGTSCAAPLWAGFTALINQRASQAGQPPVGFINPAVYAIGKSASYASDFNDVASGNNFWSSSPTKYPAVAGYDLCTGWGSPKGINLINALAVSDALGVLPGTVANFLGPMGGPFNINSQNFILSNSGASSLSWLLTNVPSWLNASSSGGTLAASGGATVTVSLNSTASNLLAGIYSTNLTFTNLNSHYAQTRSITFEPGQTVAQNGGFDSPTFLPWVFLNPMGDINLGGYNFIGSPDISPNYIHSGTYAAFLGEAGLIDYFGQLLQTTPGQSYLVSFWLRNPNNATPNAFIMNWNTNLLATNTVLNLTNFTATTSWTNFTFILAATGTNTILQFGAENDNDYFGLDDISVVPIPTPSFRAAFATNSAFSFAWNSLSNFQYVIQASTNLAKTNWVSLKTNTASGFTLSFTNSMTNSTRFYRIRRLP